MSEDAANIVDKLIDVAHSLDALSGELRQVADDLPMRRDHFAMAALTGLLSGDPAIASNPSTVAARAFAIADAMIEARKL